MSLKLRKKACYQRIRKDVNRRRQKNHIIYEKVFLVVEKCQINHVRLDSSNSLSRFYAISKNIKTDFECKMQIVDA